MKRPLVIDLFCGLGGWTRGFLAEGWDAVGFDIERHVYTGAEPYTLKEYPAELLLHDVLTLNGYDLAAANPSALAASPPCQEYSYMAMPFSRGKRIAKALRGEGEFPEGYDGSRTTKQLTTLFRACFRIRRELEAALGRPVPMVVENVKGAQLWVGRAKANFGSFYLWGDVARIGNRVVRDTVPVFGMPAVAAAQKKRPGRNFHAFENGLGSSPSFNGGEHETRGVAAKNGGNGSWFAIGSPGQTQTGGNPVNRADERGVKVSGDWFGSYAEMKAAGTISPTRLTSSGNRGTKQHGSGPEWFDNGIASVGSRSSARKAASAMIAEIPYELAAHIARVFRP